MLKGRLEQYKQSIPFDILPQNFKDAIDAAKMLEVRYFWIDSLCIIQDSGDDQKVQIPDMHNIYGCSFLNIAAANSQDSHGGLFRDRDLSLLSTTVQVGRVK